MPRQRGGSGSGRISGSSSITIDRLPAHRVALGYRIGPLPRPPCTHAIFPAIYAYRDDAGRRGYGWPAAASRTGAPIVDRSVKDAGGLDLHPILGGIAISGDLAGSLVHSPRNFRSTGPLPPAFCSNRRKTSASE